MKVQILSENRTNHPDCLAEHGLSVYIEYRDRKILFDLGASDICMRNAAKMKIDLGQVDTAVISHGHYDHTGGVPSFCGLNKKAKIYIHENSFEKTFGMEDGKLDEKNCGIRWTGEQRNEIEDRLVLTKNAVRLTEDIMISGSIPKMEGYGSTETFYIKKEDGSLIPDPMDHEQFLAIRVRDEAQKSKGVFVFSGCSHNGVIPCLRYAKALFPEERILGFLAGMHLYHTERELRTSILKQVSAENMDYILPVHCTGIQAICELKLLMGERCLPAGAGDRYHF